jgi:four helix bundle protein
MLEVRSLMFDGNVSKMKIYQKYNFENLEVYQLAKELLKDIYNISRKFPREEIFILTTQVRRAVISVILNIAEGSIRGQKEFARFIDIALGSLVEVKACCIIAQDLKYLTEKDFNLIIDKINKLFFKLLSLKRYLKKYK